MRWERYLRSYRAQSDTVSALDDAMCLCLHAWRVCLACELSLIVHHTRPQDAVTVSGFRARFHAGWDGSAFKEYQFEYEHGDENDGSSSVFLVAAEGTGRDMDCCDWQTIQFAPRHASKWRLFMEDNWGHGYLTIEYIEFQIAGECALSSAQRAALQQRVLTTFPQHAARLTDRR